MKVEVKDVLRDVQYMSEAIDKIVFMYDDNNGSVNRMPTIDKWNSGAVKLYMRSGKPGASMIACLARYGIDAKEAKENNTAPSVVTFQCDAGDDIIVMLSKALRDNRMQIKSRQLDNLNQEVEMMAQQVPYVQSSMFSRGVKNLRNSVSTLQNVVIAQQKELQK